MLRGVHFDHKIAHPHHLAFFRGALEPRGGWSECVMSILETYANTLKTKVPSLKLKYMRLEQ